MIVHGDALGLAGTFLYSGCYQAPGGLSVAQRSAWGLHFGSECELFAQHIARDAWNSSAAAFSGKAIFSTRVRSGARTHSSLPLRAADERRRSATCAQQFVKQRFQRSSKLPSLRSQTLPRTVPYRRFLVCANGRHLVCTVFRGRAYATSTQRAKERTT